MWESPTTSINSKENANRARGRLKIVIGSIAKLKNITNSSSMNDPTATAPIAETTRSSLGSEVFLIISALKMRLFIPFMVAAEKNLQNTIPIRR